MTADQTAELESLAIAAITAIIQHIEAAKSGAVDPSVPLAAIGALMQTLSERNAAKDAALDAKFPR